MADGAGAGFDLDAADRCGGILIRAVFWNLSSLMV
jgi:hypothetical protein